MFVLYGLFLGAVSGATGCALTGERGMYLQFLAPSPLLNRGTAMVYWFCRHCWHEWKASARTGFVLCPHCNSHEIRRADKAGSWVYAD